VAAPVPRSTVLPRSGRPAAIDAPHHAGGGAAPSGAVRAAAWCPRQRRQIGSRRRLVRVRSLMILHGCEITVAIAPVISHSRIAGRPPNLSDPAYRTRSDTSSAGSASPRLQPATLRAQKGSEVWHKGPRPRRPDELMQPDGRRRRRHDRAEASLAGRAAPRRPDEPMPRDPRPSCVATQRGRITPARRILPGQNQVESGRGQHRGRGPHGAGGRGAGRADMDQGIAV
jgi:hypothetical protein